MNISILLHRLVTGSILRACNLVLSAFVAFFMLPFLVEHLGTREYGLWVLVGTVMGYHSIMDFGLSLAVSRFYSQSLGRQDYEEINNIISSALATFLTIGLVVFGAVLITSSFTELFLKDPSEAGIMSKVLVVVGIAVATQFPLRTFGGVLVSVARHDLIVLTELFRLITRSSLVVYFVLNGHGILTLALTTMITEMCANFMEYKFARSQAPFISFNIKHIRISTIKRLFSFGWVAFINVLANMFRGRLLPLLVAALNGVEMVVVYSVALRLLDYFEQLIRTSLGITMPIFSQLEGQGKTEQVRQGYEIILTVTTIVATFIAANLMFFGKPFILMWMGEQFSLSYTILVLLTIPHTLFLIQVSSEELLYGMSKHLYNALINITGVLLSVIFGFILVQHFPETGIAMGFALGVGLMSLTLPYVVCKLLKINNIDGLYFKTILGTALKITTPLIVFFYLINGYVEPNIVSLLIWGTVEFIIFVPICYLVLPEKIKQVVLTQIQNALNRLQSKRGTCNVMP